MLYLSAIVLSFFLSFVLVTKRGKSAGDKILVCWLLTIGIHLLFYYLFATGGYKKNPWLIIPGFSLPLTHGPFLYLYTIYQISPRHFNRVHLLHFLPALLSLSMFSEFFFLPPGEQLSVIENKGKGFEIQSTTNLAAIYLSGVVYTAASLYRLIRYKRNIVHQFSNTDKINFNWLVYLVTWLVVIWVAVIFISSDEWTFGLVAVFIGWLGYFGIKQVQVFSQVTPASLPMDAVKASNTQEEPGKTPDAETSPVAKYQKSALPEEAANEIHRQLIALFDTTQPYKNADLTLTELAKDLRVHPNVLSQVINTKEEKTFYDLVNEKRVQEFIRLSTSPVSKQYTLLSLAFDCGFNSKASFNRNFKKHTGQTPSEFMKQKPALS